MQGTVTEFDEARGLGTVTADDGDAYSFHCTPIADGTRTIAVGTAVALRGRPGHLGPVGGRQDSSRVSSVPRERLAGRRCGPARRPARSWLERLLQRRPALPADARGVDDGGHGVDGQQASPSLGGSAVRWMAASS